MDLFWRALRKAAPTGLAGGTLYCIVIGALTFFTSTLVNQTVTLLWLVLFIGAGAGIGLLFGVICAASMSVCSCRSSRASRQPLDDRRALWAHSPAGSPYSL